MASFMTEHPNLAKNLVPNSSQGSALAKRLWDSLTTKLNAEGPPVKEARMWKKVYADQKYQAKKKLSFNKASKKKTGGGPYEEKMISFAEEQIIQASGLEAAVEGLPNVRTFGSNEHGLRASSPLLEISFNLDSNKSLDFCESPTMPEENTMFMPEEEVEFICDKENHLNQRKSCLKGRARQNRTTQPDPVLSLLEQNMQVVSDFQVKMAAKIDRLVAIQERILELKEEKQRSCLNLNRVKLKLMSKQLEKL